MEGLISSFGLDLELFLAEIVNFLVLLGIIFFVVKRYINPVLEKRRTIIADGVAKFEEAEKTLTDAELEKERMLSEAQNEASETIAASVERGKSREAEILSSAELEAASILEKAQAKGIEQKQAIIDESKEEIAKMIVLGAEKALRTK